MEIDLKALRCFVMLADELNFSRAADRLNLTQPALSSQIRVLEAKLGLALFVRTTRRVALSEQGVALLPSARRMIEESQSLQRAVADLQGRPRRKLGLGAAFYTIDIPERVHLLEGFFAAHPSVALDVVPAWQRDLVEDLQNDRLDVALVIGLPVSRLQLAREVEIEPNVEILYPDDLPRMVLRREPVGLLVPRESALAALDVVPQAALAGLRVAMLGPHHGQAVIAPIRSVLDSAGATAVIPPEPHGIGVERFGRQFRIPAITLGWFGAGGPNDDMVRRPVEGLYLSTELALLRAPGTTTAEAALFWDDARSVLDQAQAI
jgi:DNA-binding transcriptional LysR family regulator